MEGSGHDWGESGYDVSYRAGFVDDSRGHGADQPLDCPDGVWETGLVFYHSQENETAAGTGPEETGCEHHVTDQHLGPPNCWLALGPGMVRHWHCHQRSACSAIEEPCPTDREEHLEQPKAAQVGFEPERLGLWEQDFEAPEQELVAEVEKQQVDSAAHWQDFGSAHRYSFLQAKLPAGLQPARWRQWE